MSETQQAEATAQETQVKKLHWKRQQKLDELLLVQNLNQQQTNEINELINELNNLN